ncbi:hypothetical protein KIW84_014786 [Lathyrus oleraceus]|uniref:Reverse transcriptase domain-containing protein n=1 Tax=Pisum sativum TaxID=3888 RepID=A0A9D5BNR5_PEA|nr:hypothetical protein KIW84_014786 [Pisum sativum]
MISSRATLPKVVFQDVCSKWTFRNHMIQLSDSRSMRSTLEFGVLIGASDKGVLSPLYSLLLDDTTSINLLMDAFEEFSKFIDLSVNPAKFKVYFTNVDLQTKQEIQDMTKFTEGPLPFRYLGVSLTSKKLSIINVSLLLIKLLLGLDTGSAKLLRFAGKSQLIKSVLFDVINFWMQCIPLPKKIIQNIEVVCRSFLWTRGETISRKSHVAWHNVCTPKNQRGLNIISIKE